MFKGNLLSIIVATTLSVVWVVAIVWSVYRVLRRGGMNSASETNIQ